ncbi:PepSY domain-containing protein [Brachybacterium aquaticum]|uniref:Putative membrane protein YkoI n=1 Tax=Brachybacterium aquaticum TaxID=1432564 RepID=A0A841A6J9_9MICO|nr:PepSY domain-containing protein [Brachybacterium aquaticum]MBB5830799.1 putative membrane protein YkoI [Brachybacterium aquaticum]
MARTILTPRTARTAATGRGALRSVALGALVVGLAAGCGSSGTTEAPAIEGPGASAEEGADESTADDSATDEASDGGAGASDGGGASDDGGAAAGAAGAALPEDADLATEQLPIPAEEAVRLGTDAVSGGVLTSLEIDHDDDQWEWEVELVVDGVQHDLDIDATTGEITEHDQDDDDDDQDPAVDVTSPMPYAEAIELAVGQEPGRVSGWDLDSDDGTIRYQIDIERSGGDDVEVEVDVETGEVRVED